MSELAFNRILLQKHNQILAIAVLVSMAINILLGAGVLVLSNRKPLLIAQSDEGLKTLDEQKYKLDEDMLKGFAGMISAQYLTFTSKTLVPQIERISRYLDSQPVTSILDSYKQNQAKMVSDNVVHEFSLQEMTITKKNSPYWIELSGTRTIYANANKKSKPVVYLFEIKKVKPARDNPYGLTVTKIVEKKTTDNKDN